jgi:L-amino acid N-acyltransferase YncA
MRHSNSFCTIVERRQAISEEAVVRRVRPDDLDAIARIYSRYVTDTIVSFEEEPPTVGDWLRRHREIDRRGMPFLAAELGGEIAGYAYCSPWRSRSAYRHTVEDSVYLAPHAVGRGVGRALLTELLSRCADLDVRQVVAVIVRPGDPAPVALHERLGFVAVGTLRKVGYKNGRWLDTLLMQRALSR